MFQNSALTMIFLILPEKDKGYLLQKIALSPYSFDRKYWKKTMFRRMKIDQMNRFFVFNKRNLIKN